MFIGEYVAQESPMEKGVFITPIHSTFVRLPAEKKNYFRSFSIEKQKWEQIAIVTPEEDIEALAVEARVIRAQLFAELDARIARHERELRTNKTPSDGVESLDKYGQALADITKQKGFPKKITWPTLE